MAQFFFDVEDPVHLTMTTLIKGFTTPKNYRLVYWWQLHKWTNYEGLIDVKNQLIRVSMHGKDTLQRTEIKYVYSSCQKHRTIPTEVYKEVHVAVGVPGGAAVRVELVAVGGDAVVVCNESIHLSDTKTLFLILVHFPGI